MEQNLTEVVNEEDLALLHPGESQEGGAAEDDDEGESTVKVDRELETELAGAKDDAEREKIRERRKLDRRNKTRRQKEVIDTLKSENQMLLQRLQQVEAVTAGLQGTTFTQALSKVDEEIGKAQNAQSYFLRVEAEAITKNDGARATQARVNADAARQRAEQLAFQRNQAVAAAQQPRQPQMPAHVTQRALDFKSRHSWYEGPESNDPDSIVLTALDAGLTREGWDPQRPEYWEELEKRAAMRLAHRIEKNYDGGTESQGQRSSQGRAQPVAGSNGGASAPSGGAEKVGRALSAERVKAMKAAGIWDDQKRRDAMIKRFNDYDRTH